MKNGRKKFAQNSNTNRLQIVHNLLKAHLKDDRVDAHGKGVNGGKFGGEQFALGHFISTGVVRLAQLLQHVDRGQRA